MQLPTSLFLRANLGRSNFAQCVLQTKWPCLGTARIAHPCSCAFSVALVVVAACCRPAFRSVASVASSSLRFNHLLHNPSLNRTPFRSRLALRYEQWRHFISFRYLLQ